MSQTYKYRAFISYSHADIKFARWLQKKIENYKIPKSLREKYLHLPKDLKRSIFRDEEELPTASALPDNLTEALQQSEILIVIASPNAVKSEWVEKEIRYFKSYHGEDKVLVIMREGEPNEAFSKALRYRVDNQGELTDIATEPIAGDARSFWGRKRGLMKLIAGVLRVDFADLWERERREYRKQKMILSAIFSISIGIVIYTNNYIHILNMINTSLNKKLNEKDEEKNDILSSIISYLSEKKIKKVQNNEYNKTVLKFDDEKNNILNTFATSYLGKKKEENLKSIIKSEKNDNSMLTMDKENNINEKNSSSILISDKEDDENERKNLSSIKHNIKYYSKKIKYCDKTSWRESYYRKKLFDSYMDLVYFYTTKGDKIEKILALIKAMETKKNKTEKNYYILGKNYILLGQYLSQKSSSKPPL